MLVRRAEHLPWATTVRAILPVPSPSESIRLRGQPPAPPSSSQPPVEVAIEVDPRQ